MATIQHARGTRAALDALASGGLLVPWQLYALSDENRVAIATSTSTYQAFAKEGEGGGSSSVTVAQGTVSPATYGEASFTVSDASATGSKRVLCSLAPNPDWDVDDLSDLRVLAVASTGAVTFYLYRDGPIVGTFDVTYLLG